MAPPSIGRAVSRWAVAAGMTSRANTSRAPVIWLASAAAKPSRTQEHHDTTRTGTPRADGHVGVDRGEQQRSADDTEHPECPECHEEQA